MRERYGGRCVAKVRSSKQHVEAECAARAQHASLERRAPLFDNRERVGGEVLTGAVDDGQQSEHNGSDEDLLQRQRRHAASRRAEHRRHEEGGREEGHRAQEPGRHSERCLQPKVGGRALEELDTALGALEGGHVPKVGTQAPLEARGQLTLAAERANVFEGLSVAQRTRRGRGEEHRAGVHEGVEPARGGTQTQSRRHVLLLPRHRRRPAATQAEDQRGRRAQSRRVEPRGARESRGVAVVRWGVKEACRPYPGRAGQERRRDPRRPSPGPGTGPGTGHRRRDRLGGELGGFRGIVTRQGRAGGRRQGRRGRRRDVREQRLGSAQPNKGPRAREPVRQQQRAEPEQQRRREHRLARLRPRRGEPPVHVPRAQQLREAGEPVESLVRAHVERVEAAELSAEHQIAHRPDRELDRRRREQIEREIRAHVTARDAPASVHQPTTGRVGLTEGDVEAEEHVRPQDELDEPIRPPERRKGALRPALVRDALPAVEQHAQLQRRDDEDKEHREREDAVLPHARRPTVRCERHAGRPLQLRAVPLRLSLELGAAQCALALGERILERRGAAALEALRRARRLRHIGADRGFQSRLVPKLHRRRDATRWIGRSHLGGGVGDGRDGSTAVVPLG